MLNNPTINEMIGLGLTGMVAAWRELAEQPGSNELGRDEWLGLMVDREVTIRADKRIRNKLAAAKLRFADASIEDIDFVSPRGLDRRDTLALAQGGWLKANENMIITDQTGTGKSWLACAFARQAARLDHSVFYARVPRLFEDLALSRRDGSYPRLFAKLTRVQLLVLDDFGTHALSDQQRFHLFEIVEERYHRKSTLITAQVPVAAWHDLIADSTIADAVLDRIVHNAHRIELAGESMRCQKAISLLTPPQNSEIHHP